VPLKSYGLTGSHHSTTEGTTPGQSGPVKPLLGRHKVGTTDGHIRRCRPRDVGPVPARNELADRRILRGRTNE
jgi:hypothetical protein